jgi:FKBP-type peptidyl-prolyl cis-trans isomerase
MQSTGTGLRIEVYEKGTGRQSALKDTVSIAYKVFLLDGTLCYSADETHRLRFILGTGQQTSGLEEGLQLMQQGAKARMVVPKHLAYGMAGDENKIPAGSALYYEVTLLKVN